MKFRTNSRSTGYIIEQLQQHNRWRKYSGPYNSKGSANSRLRQLRREFGLDGDDINQRLVSRPWDKHIFQSGGI